MFVAVRVSLWHPVDRLERLRWNRGGVVQQLEVALFRKLQLVLLAGLAARDLAWCLN